MSILDIFGRVQHQNSAEFLSLVKEPETDRRSQVHVLFQPKHIGFSLLSLEMFDRRCKQSRQGSRSATRFMWCLGQEDSCHVVTNWRASAVAVVWLTLELALFDTFWPVSKWDWSFPRVLTWDPQRWQSERFFHHMARAMTSSSVQNAMRDCKASGNWQRALIWLRTSQGQKVQMDLMMHNLAIGACEKATMWSFTLNLLAGLGFEADVVSFTTTMNALGKGSEWQRSINLLHETIVTISIQPNLMTWNTCVSAWRAEWQQGLAMLEACPGS